MTYKAEAIFPPLEASQQAYTGSNAEQAFVKSSCRCRSGQLVRRLGGFSTPEAKKRTNAYGNVLTSLLLKFAQQSGVAPFSADTFWKLHRPKFKKEDVQKQLNYIAMQKKMVRLNDNRFLSIDAIDEIQRRVTQGIERKGFVTVRDCKELLGYGRWGGAHVLDYLNQIGFTVRREDRHFLRNSRINES
jgi:selenocysteine-specific elongation factor